MLKNKYTPLFFLLVIAGMLIFLVQYCDSAQETKPIGDRKIPKSYGELKKEIETLSSKDAKWNKTQYGSLQEMIESFEDGKLITSTQSNELADLLASYHIALLTTAVQVFCEKSNDISQLRAMEEDITKLQKKYAGAVGSAKKWADHYNKIISLLASGKTYAMHQAYNEGTTQQYDADLKEYQIIGYIKDNKVIQDDINATLVKIGKHKAIGVKFGLKKKDIERLDCAEYKENSYYFGECDKLKNPEKYEPKKDEPKNKKD